jgi:hypothetical protein
LSTMSQICPRRAELSTEPSGALFRSIPTSLRLPVDLGGCQSIENWPGFPRGRHRQQPPVEDVLDESHTMPGDERG